MSRNKVSFGRQVADQFVNGYFKPGFPAWLTHKVIMLVLLGVSAVVGVFLVIFWPLGNLFGERKGTSAK